MNSHFSHSLTLVLLGAVFAVAQPASGQDSFDRAPIKYSSAETHDPIAQLQVQIDEGKVALRFDKEFGYLKSVLEALDISPSSQMLVFSKTSFQARRISPSNPRAVYFNDNSYVGWVPRGDVVEVSAVDPRQGAVFYTLEQVETEQPKFVRDQGNCLTCHASSRTHGVPGHLVRSVYPAASGHPHFGAGTFNTNHSSPFNRRWGGWYVTGTHGAQRHMGNAISRDRTRPENLDTEAGANLTDLSDLTRIDRYLTSHSDIVALMVLEHQTEMHNFITLANYETRFALHHDNVMNQAFDREDDYTSESTERRIAAVSEKLLKYMLFADEISLTDPIAGTSEFAAKFVARGPQDDHGRSLRELDLQQRLFKYPCSYLIYSKAFCALPSQVKDVIYRRLWEILTSAEKQSAEDESAEQDQDYAHLSQEDRLAIFEILRDTHPDLPDYWKTDTSPP